MQTLECVLWHSGLKCEVVFDQGVSQEGDNCIAIVAQ